MRKHSNFYFVFLWDKEQHPMPEEVKKEYENIFMVSFICLINHPIPDLRDIITVIITETF